MREIALDGSSWKSIDDFYSALLPAIGAPAYHAPGITAIIDSIIGGDMNAIEPPFVIKIYNTDHIDRKIADHLVLAKESLALSRADTAAFAVGGRDIEATIEICRSTDLL